MTSPGYSPHFPHRLPVELFDAVIDHVPTRYLSTCALVCKSWLHAASPRLLHTVAWPSRLLNKRVRGLQDVQPYLPRTQILQRSFTLFVETLNQSFRLQEAICHLRIGPKPHPNPQPPERRFHLDLNLLAYILHLCHHLDTLTISHCRVLPASQPSVCANELRRNVKKLALVRCGAAQEDMIGLSGVISLFACIDHLYIQLLSGRGGHDRFTPPASVRIGRIETDQLTHGYNQGTLSLLRHLCASPCIRTSLRALTTGDAERPENLKFLHGMSGLEEYAYCAHPDATPAFSSLPALRQLTIYAGKPTEQGVVHWSSVMRDLASVPPHLQRLEIVANHTYCTQFSAIALREFEAELDALDWVALERCLRSRPTLARVELRMRCKYGEPGYGSYHRRSRDLDFDRVQEVALRILACRLAQGAMRCIAVS